MRYLTFLLFYFPLITNVLNVQGFISKFVSESFSQIFAYLNVVFLMLGILLIMRESQKFAVLVKLWIVFYLVYYTFALLANIHLDTQVPLLRTLVPITYFLAFSFLLSKPEFLKPIGKTLAISFFLTCILLIVLDYFNFSMDYSGIYEYELERAGGVYGDANNASVAAILSFIFLKHFIQPKNNFEKVIKIITLLISTYGILITFSKTGFVAFLIVLAVTYHKLFSPKRMILSLVFVPISFLLLINWALTSDKLSFGQKQRVDSLINILTLNTSQVGLSDRDVLFQNMLNHIFERPLLGNGVNFSNIIRGHNTIFGIWADAGILTFLIFLLLLFLYFKKAFNSPNSTKYFALSVLLTLTIFMLTLQTIINQGYLMVVFVLLGYMTCNYNSDNLNKIVQF
ncbi:hypothetical protein [uncultured Zobellia sp.]|uniref:O-antigen ligase family protein n=1 Tax=uncultured Zobellia sp. TaxID=255433 RepID=UPI0025927065|nr:hypothetical protein [uncultured Zobellia sp.]